jgi:uncharacterized membrane protein SpoIIM required for sporulation
VIVDPHRFIENAQPRWRAFEVVLTQMENNPQGSSDIQRAKSFYNDYLEIASDLSQVRSFVFDRGISTHLESLVARAALQMYPQERRTPFRPLKWFLSDFPSTFRRHFNLFLLSVGITFVGVIFGMGAITLDPPSKAVLIPFSHLNGRPSERVKHEESVLNPHDHRVDQSKARFSAQLMTHNTKVSITTMAMGLSYGIGTVILLFYNGLILGAVAIDYIADGQSIFLLGWLLPHGVIEIPAILLAGQTGLILAWAMIDRRREGSLGERLRHSIRDVATLIGGVAIMLVWAGLIEAFLSQYHEPILPYWVKILFGICELIGLGAFLLLGGRKDKEAKRGAVL